VLDRAGAIVWLVIGESKAAVLPRLLAADPTIPAGRVRQDRALVIADAPAASALT
jgi:6-phosphogluconolactonase/glucosamine-6-phosphate isomerase/deaminase